MTFREYCPWNMLCVSMFSLPTIPGFGMNTILPVTLMLPLCMISLLNPGLVALAVAIPAEKPHVVEADILADACAYLATLLAAPEVPEVPELQGGCRNAAV